LKIEPKIKKGGSANDDAPPFVTTADGGPDLVCIMLSYALAAMAEFFGDPLPVAGLFEAVLRVTVPQGVSIGTVLLARTQGCQCVPLVIVHLFQADVWRD